jgi:hypothetical protein
MRYPLLPVTCVLTLLAFLGACKKAEQPAANGTPAEHTDTEHRAQSETAPAAMAEPSGNAEAVTLRIKWPVGSRLTYRMDTDMNMTNRIPQMPRPIVNTTSMSMTYSLTAVSETAEGGRELEVEFLAGEMEMKMGEQVMFAYDSKEKSAAVPNPLSEPFRKVIGSNLRVQVNAAGRVDKVLNLEQWRKGLAGDASGPAVGLLAQQFNDGYLRQIVDLGIGLPDKPVRPGDTWPLQLEVPAGSMGKITVDSKVTFQRWEERQKHKCAALGTVGTFAGSGLDGGPMGKLQIEDGNATGTSWFDPELGTLVESSVDETMRLKGDMPTGLPRVQGNNSTAGSFAIELAQKRTVNLVDETKVKP